MSETIRRVSGTKYANIVCKFCAHPKAWHDFAGCHVSDDAGFDCDCPAWDYGTNVEVVADARRTEEE